MIYKPGGESHGSFGKRDTVNIQKKFPNGCIVNIFYFFMLHAYEKFIYSSHCEFIFAIHIRKNFYYIGDFKKYPKREDERKKEVIRYLCKLDIQNFKADIEWEKKLFTLKLCEAENILDNKFSRYKRKSFLLKYFETVWRKLIVVSKVET